jgi:excisionase family DNA binding protein
MMREKSNTQPISVGINAAAEMTGLSPAHLRREIARGELPVVRIGRRVLIRTTALEQYIEHGAEHAE